MATKYLTVSEVADILRLTPYGVTRLCRARKLPAMKPAGQWLIPEDEFLAHLEASRNSHQQDVA